MIKKIYANDGCAESEPDADHSVDLAMLYRFFVACEERLISYSRMLELIVANATGFDDSKVRRSRESKVDEIVATMSVMVKPALQSEERMAVSRFLIDLQADWKGEPVRCRDYVASCACALAELVVTEAADDWRKLREAPRRHSKSASEAFFSEVFPELPKPQELYALVMLEYARARKALKEEMQKAQCETS